VLSIAKTAISSLPSVCLVVLLTLLDAMSYGIIVFPHSDPHIPASAPAAGISMFLASSIISQIVYTGGGSAFKCAVGSMMIEVMPFLHIMCAIVEEQMQQSSNHEILATIMVSYCSSTIMTGIVFFLVGIFNLGTMIQFFPRHILVGCIGGIGLFLLFTGIEVTAKVAPDISLDYLFEIFTLSKFMLWGSCIAGALVLKILQHFVSHPMLIPLFYASLPALFYIIVFSVGISLDELRDHGWLFHFDSGKVAPFYEFWTYFDFSVVNWTAVLSTIPTQLALTFFGILHVPINVPALSVSTRQDVDLSKEIIGHGISNIVAGLFGTPQVFIVVM
jgi:SulP family sulfate permease